MRVKKSAVHKVLSAAKARHASALRSERRAASARSRLPHATVFHMRSPMNIVADLLTTSQAAIFAAMSQLPVK